MDAFLARRPFRLISEQASPSYPTSLFWVFRIVEAPPSAWAAQIGDAIHNLRSALDLMASDLVRLNGGKEGRGQFPFAEHEKDLDLQIKRKGFNLVATDVLDLLRTIEPFRGGNIVLRGLHDLDVRDKHKSLIPAVTYMSSIPYVIETKDSKSESILLDLRTHQSMVAVDGTVLFIHPSDDPLMQIGFGIGEEIDCSFDLVFPHDTVFSCDKIIPTLHRLNEQVSGTIKAFQALCESRPNVISVFADPALPVKAIALRRGAA